MCMCTYIRYLHEILVCVCLHIHNIYIHAKPGKDDIRVCVYIYIYIYVYIYIYIHNIYIHAKRRKDGGSSYSSKSMLIHASYVCTYIRYLHEILYMSSMIVHCFKRCVIKILLSLHEIFVCVCIHNIYIHAKQGEDDGSSYCSKGMLIHAKLAVQPNHTQNYIHVPHP
jgi:hypothetical protein